MVVALDTNVLIAAFVARGVCHELIEHLARTHEAVVSPFILAEFEGKLVEKFNATPGDAGAAVELLTFRFRVVDPAPLDEPVCRDPDDDHVLALAAAARAACLVSGDRDLLDLERFGPTVILAPAAFWRFEDEHTRLGGPRQSP